MKIALHNAHVSASMNFHFMNKWESKSSLLGTVFACTDCKVLLKIFGKPDFEPSIVCVFFKKTYLLLIIILCYEEVQEKHLICVKYNVLFYKKSDFLIKSPQQGGIPPSHDTNTSPLTEGNEGEME